MVSPSRQTIERRVRAFVADGSGLDRSKVIPANEGPEPKPSPSGLYATVLLITPSMRGSTPAVRQTLAEGNVVHKTRSVVRDVYSVQWFRAGAQDAARTFAAWIPSPDGLDGQVDGSFTVLRVANGARVDEIVSKEWEERASLDLTVSYTHTIQQTRIPATGADITVQVSPLGSETIEVRE